MCGRDRPTEVGLVLAALDLDPAGPRLDQEVSDQLLLGVHHCDAQEAVVTRGNKATLRFEPKTKTVSR